MKITAIVAPHGARGFEAVDEFAAALGTAAGIEVPVIEGSLADAPGDGYLVVFDADTLLAHPDLGPRVVLVNADRASVLADLERHHLAGAIEKHRYFQWRTQRDAERGRGVFGRKDVAVQLDGMLDTGYQETADYALLASSRHTDLPSLLAGYLAAHDGPRGRAR